MERWRSALLKVAAWVFLNLLKIAALLFVVPAALAGAAQGGQAGLSQASTLKTVGAGQTAAAERARRFLQGRSMGDGRSAAAALDLARRQHLKLVQEGIVRPRVTSLSAGWQAVGPLQIASQSFGLVTGRVTSLAIDPEDATGNTVYVGTTGGGVWKSTNAAGAVLDVFFTPLTDTLPVFLAGSETGVIPSLSIGALSVGDGVVLAGTGDPNEATDSYYGSGLLRSADGGATWTLIQAANDGTAGDHFWIGLGFAGIAWSSATQGTVVAAVTDAAEGTLVNATSVASSVKGLYYSTDAGVTWQMATVMDGGQTVQSAALSSAGYAGNAATAVVWNPVRQMFYAAVRFHGYYQSPDGATWTRMASQPGTGLTTTACPTEPGTTGSTGCPIFRGVLAVEPVSGDTYAFSVDSNNLDQGIWRDVCGLASGSCASPAAAFGTRLATAALEQGGSTEIAQGDYDLSLAAVNSGADTVVFAGTIDLYRCSIAAGCAFRNTTNVENGCAAPAMVSPAQHALAGLTTAGLPLLFLGNDGGLWRSTDGVNEQGSPCAASDASHFDNLNGGLGSLAEVVGFAQHPTDPDTLLAGLGANGSVATSAASSGAAWPQLASGEGGYVAIDPVTPMNWYFSNGPGVSIEFCGNGAACEGSNFTAVTPTIDAAQVDEDDSLVDAPWLLDPVRSTQAVIGTCRVWRGASASNAAWTGSNALSTDLGSSSNVTCSVTNSAIRSLSVGGAASSSTAAAPNAGSEVLYAGMAGVLDGGLTTDGGHVFATTAGATAGPATVWTDVAAGAPVLNDQTDAGAFNPGGFDVSSLAVDPHDATGQTIYATVMGFAGNGTNAPHLYWSTDGGAQWTNISSNLPNAPANSVVVDPNDANTVYVALDTGVYVTSSVSECSTANCWNVYGTQLPSSPVIQLSAEAMMPTGQDDTQGELRAATYGRGIWEIPLLTASPIPRPAMTLNPASLTFATQQVASVSAAQTITVTNTGTAPLVVSSVTVTGDFAETDTCAGATFAVGQSCAVNVEFLPTVVGARSGVLTVFGNVTGGQATANLTGTGAVAAAIQLTPLVVSFAQATVGATTAAQDVTISNLGGVTATLGTPTVTGEFTMTANTCGATLAASTECTVAIEFAPTTPGAQAGTLSITDSVGTQTASLTGTGLSVATDALAPLMLTFAPLEVGTVSAPQLLTLTNAGDEPLTAISAVIGGGNFAVTNGCGNTLIGHSSCTLAVSATPQSVGAETAVLTVADQFRSQSVALNGTGLTPPGVSLAPAGGLSFATTVLGSSSAAQMVTLTNNGGVVLTIGSIVVSGDFAIRANACGSTLAAGAACTIQIVFAPTVAGTRTGAITLTDDAATSPQALPLTGMGVSAAAIQLVPVTVSFAPTTVGATAMAQNVTISNTGGVPATLGVPVVTGDFALAANTCGATLAAVTGCTVAITFSPVTTGVRTGMLTVTDSVGTQTALLSGTGQSVATDALAPLTLNFAPQQVTTTSASQLVTLTNAGDTPLTGISGAIASGDFTVASGSTVMGGCGGTLAGHSTCVFSVSYGPQNVGAETGVLVVNDQYRTQRVALTGTGVASSGVSLTPLNGLTFAPILVASSSAPQTVTLTNNGDVALAISVFAVTGDFRLSASGNTCGAMLAAGAACTMQVVFTPAAAGVRAGTVAVTDDAENSPQTVELSGTGLGFSLTAAGPTSMTAANGASVVYALQLTSPVGVTGSATLTCTGAPVDATCVMTPSSAPLGATTPIMVTVATGVATGAQARVRGSDWRQVGWLATLLPLFFGFGFGRGRQSRGRWARLLAILALGGLGAAVGCGAGRTIPPAGPASLLTPTASGTYTLMASATNAGSTQSVTLTLVVQ